MRKRHMDLLPLAPTQLGARPTTQHAPRLGLRPAISQFVGQQSNLDLSLGPTDTVQTSGWLQH